MHTNIYLFLILTIPALILLLVFLMVIVCIYGYFELRQKTRDTQQGRIYAASTRQRPSLSAQQPSIYITPVNMPPPKYEFMAPPSYEDVVGVHYPTFSSEVAVSPGGSNVSQPIIPPASDVHSSEPAVITTTTVTSVCETRISSSGTQTVAASS